nr:magnesium transporter [Cryptococcus depauperatus CBS 7841]
MSRVGHLRTTIICLAFLPLRSPKTSYCRAPRCQTARTFLSRRRTSFWAPSYPVESENKDQPLAITALQVPLTPPSPSDKKSLQDVMLKPREYRSRHLESLMDKAGEMSLRCSIIDAQGNWGADGQKYQKAGLCREYDLDFRDLRKLDSISPNLVPVILTRKTCILISILHIRALIKPDSVIVFDSAGGQAREVQRKFKYHLEKNIKSGLADKRRALESILVATANALEEEMAFTRHLVQQLLKDLEDDIDRENLKKLLHYSKKIAAFQSRARYVKSAIDEILDSDEDLSAMYLTSRAQGRPRALHDHEQLELLLESFVKQVEEIVSEVDTTVANMVSTQEIAELMLDSGRNALLALDIKISIATLGIGTGALFAGFFGMNVPLNLQFISHLEETPYAFLAISSTAFLVTLLITVYGLRILRRIRRVALSGRNPTVLSSVLGSAQWESSVAQFSRGFNPSLVDIRAQAAKRAIWERMWHKYGRPWRKEPQPRNKWVKGYSYTSMPSINNGKRAQAEKWRHWNEWHQQRH